MIAKLRDGYSRIRRNIAQRGLRNAMNNIVYRMRTGNFSTERAKSVKIEGTHPFDASTGVNTGGYIHGSELRTGHPHDLYIVSYYGSAPSLVEAVLTRWLETPPVKPIEEYTFIDFGSGKGRVVLLASKLPFQRCIGVEFNAGLNAIAAENMERWAAKGNPLSPMEAVCREATEFQFPATPCLVYLFNPFTGKVLERLLDRIADTFAGRPGELDLLYVNAEFQLLLEARPGFQKLWEMPIQMSAEDAAADLLYNDEHGNPENKEALQEPCSGWRWVGERSA